MSFHRGGRQETPLLKRSSGEIVEWRPGGRGDAAPTPILQREDLELLHGTLRSVEELLGSAPDVEWTGRASDLTLLQARPVTTAVPQDDDERGWYLSLRPGKARLDALCERVTGELIPRLEEEAARFAGQEIESHDDARLADALDERAASLEEWRRIYWDEFIPFAHGVRRLALYYNDAVRPDDPYEFLGLLRGQAMLAGERNASLGRLASELRARPGLQAAVEKLAASGAIHTREDWRRETQALAGDRAAAAFLCEMEACIDRHLNIAFGDERLDERPDLVLGTVLELARAARQPGGEPGMSAAQLERRLLDAVGTDRAEEALDVLRVGRLSWKLRDDDNVLMGRLENQIQRALREAARRLRDAGRLAETARIEPATAGILARALREPGGGPVALPPPRQGRAGPAASDAGETPRQMIGQPAAPGLATGLVRVVRRAEDIGAFRSGEVLVCDAIQPTMTHVVPLASAVVERRGGMLIHGAIIARELGVPCVNGIAGLLDALETGDLVTVDGNLGIVTVGPPEFDMERREAG